MPRISRIFNLLKEGVARGVFPGAVCGIRKEDRTWVVSAGYLALTPFLEPVEPHYLYDLASLTKPLAGALILIHKLGQKAFPPLTTPLGEFFPELEDSSTDVRALANLPLYRLLNHTAGLKAWLPLYQHRPLTLPKAVKLIFQDPLAYKPGTCYLYSDLGYFLLTYLLERYFQKSFGELFAEVKAHLGLSPKAKLTFQPLLNGIDQEDIAPTSVAEEMGKILRGLVEDENTRALGGISGVAGLFGNVYSVLEVLFALLSSYHGEGPLPQEVVKYFLEFSEERSQFVLGFMKASADGHSAFGGAFGKKAVGHLGFTGSSFLLDPEQSLIIILLTNRVHPDRGNNLIREFRPYFHQEVAKILKL